MSGWPRILAGVLVVMLAIAYIVAWRAPAVGTFHDDAVYLVTAKALAEGKGYRIISLPEEIPQTKYPILFPLVLAGVWKLNPDFPSNVPLLKLVPLLFTLVWLLVSFRLLREEGVAPTWAAGVCLLVACSPWVIYLSAALLSESLFCCLVTGGLIFLRRAERRLSMRETLFAAVLAAAAFHTRTLGVALVMAGPLTLWLAGRRKPAMIFALVAAALCAPWVVWVAAHSPGSAAPAFYSGQNYQGWNILLGFSPVQKAQIFFQNFLMTVVSPAALLGVPIRGLGMLLAFAVGGFLIWVNLRSGRNAFSLFLGAYTVLILCWAWPPTRFVEPLLPLVFLPVCRFLETRSAAIRQATGFALVLLAVPTLCLSAMKANRLGDPMPALDESDSYWALRGLLADVKAPPDTVFAGNLDPLYYLLTGHKSVRGFAADPYSLIYGAQDEPLGKASDLARGVCQQGAALWIRSPNSAFIEGKYLDAVQRGLSQRHPDGLAVERRTTNRHEILRLSCEHLRPGG